MSDTPWLLYLIVGLFATIGGITLTVTVGRGRTNDVPWISFMIVGLLATVLGIALVSITGLGALSLGTLFVGFLLNLAAVFRFLERRTGTEEER